MIHKLLLAAHKDFRPVFRVIEMQLHVGLIQATDYYATWWKFDEWHWQTEMFANQETNNGFD